MVQPTNPVYDMVASREEGTVFKLVQGKDFGEDPENFRSSIIHGLRRRGIKCQTRVSGREIHVTILNKGEQVNG